MSFSTLYGAGLCYWASRTWLRHTGEFGEPTPHFLEKLTGPLHLSAAFFFIFSLGVVWTQHIRPSRRKSLFRFTGWAFLVLIATLTLSGVLMIYFGGQRWMDWIALAHPLVGASLLIVLLTHWHRKKSR